jgi:NAD(P)-dependent dehydrogenase (short-subunit alcohol dehydrogenase family)
MTEHNIPGGRLAGKTALVTGSTRGIGRSIASRLGGEGASIIVSGRKQEDVEGTIAELAGEGIPATGFAADLAQAEDAHRLGKAAIEAAPRFDILVNNAGMSIREDFWNVSDENWEYQTNVNYRSPFILAQYAARRFIADGTPGRIVNTSTVGAHSVHWDALVYDSAKAAVEAMTRNMAFEVGRHQITVNCVVPGPIADRPGARGRNQFWDLIERNVPVGRVGTAEDVAAAVLFFALPETSYTTGQSLVIDGGYIIPLPKERL